MRVKQQDVRVIYGILDAAGMVFVIAVRRRNEATYKIIPIKALNSAITEAIAMLKTKPKDC